MQSSINRQEARYHELPVRAVVPETDDAVSIVFDAPADAYAYTAGQFVTLRVEIDGAVHHRSYSMSSAPGIDADLQVTVKRVPGGLVSNWLVETVAAGDVLDVSVPSGAFVLRDDDDGDDIVAFAAGSGITPIFSIVKTALHGTGRRVRLLFANRDRQSAIFGPTLDDLARRFTDRFVLVHHEDVVDGFVAAGDVTAFLGQRFDAVFYVCGPTGFMDVVETALHAEGVEPDRINIERFTPVVADPPPASEDAPATSSVTITVGKRTETVAQRGRSTVLESARWAGLPAPSSCEAGHCATCMARVVEGRVDMATNDVLTPEELEEGWVLTCQSVPVTPVVRVVYEP